MRFLSSVFFLSTCAFAANYPLQQSYLLDAGVTSITVTNSGSGGGTYPIVLPASITRARFTISENCVPPAGTKENTAGTTTYTDLNGSPAAVSVFLNQNVGNGGRETSYTCYWWEDVQSNGTVKSPRVQSSRLTIPWNSGTLAVCVLPIEVVGQDGFTKACSFTPSILTGVRLRIRGHNLGYRDNPVVDGKLSYRINGGTWVAMTNALMTEIGEQKTAGGIGASVLTLEGTFAVSDGTLVSGTNSIEFRFNKTDKVSSGGTILDFNFIQTAIATTAFTCSGGTCTMTCAATCSFSTGDWVYQYSQAGGVYNKANGNFQITATDSTHYTWTPCRSTRNMLTGACTNANVTAAAPPTAQFPLAYFTQRSGYVARESIAFSQFTEDDSQVWAAMSGGVAATGLTDASTTDLVVPNAAGNNFTTAAKCTDCHFHDMKDLYTFGYSNQRIMARSLFHGLTWQQGKNIIALIRSYGTVPQTAAPWNPPYQPCPGLDSNALAAWPAGGGIDCVLNYDHDMKEYVAPSGSYSGWSRTGKLNWHEIPQGVQYTDWNGMLPALWPGDFTYRNSSDAPIAYTSILSGCRADALSVIVSGNVSSFAAYDGCPGGVYHDAAEAHHMTAFGSEVKAWVDTINPGRYGIGGSAPIWKRPSSYGLAIQSVHNKAIVDLLDVNITKAFDGKLTDIFTALYGAPSSSYSTRGIYASTVIFDSAPHFVEIPENAPYGLFDNTRTSWRRDTNWRYLLTMVLNDGNRHIAQNKPGDLAYLPAYVAGDTINPLGYLINMVTISNIQNSAEINPDTEGVGSDLGLNASIRMILSSLGDGSNERQSTQVFTTIAERVLQYTAIIDSITATLAAYNPTQWRTVDPTYAATPVPSNAAAGASSNHGDAWAYMLPIMKFLGVNTTSLNNLVTQLNLVYTHDFTTDLAATCSWADGTPPSSTAIIAKLPACSNL